MARRFFRRLPRALFQSYRRSVERWFPPLSWADFALLAVTLLLVFSASRLGQAADALERLLRRR